MAGFGIGVRFQPMKRAAHSERRSGGMGAGLRGLAGIVGNDGTAAGLRRKIAAALPWQAARHGDVGHAGKTGAQNQFEKRDRAGQIERDAGAGGKAGLRHIPGDRKRGLLQLVRRSRLVCRADRDRVPPIVEVAQEHFGDGRCRAGRCASG